MTPREDAMTNTRRLMTCTAAIAAIAALAATAPAATQASAADIMSEWTSVKLPPAPELKPVTVDGRTTALLILDFMKEGCNRRPRCLAIVPGMKKLHDAARANGAMLFYSLVGGTNPTARDVVE